MSNKSTRPQVDGLPSVIRAVGLKGYKSIRDQQSIEIRPLTLLAGANSSGKSSIMQAILLLKQTIEAAYDPGPLLLDGPNVNFSRASQMFYNGKTPKKINSRFL